MNFDSDKILEEIRLLRNKVAFLEGYLFSKKPCILTKVIEEDEAFTAKQTKKLIRVK